ncbi:MAG: hypothetical protein AAFV69_00430 [Pseudomonadota bacterium]
MTSQNDLKKLRALDDERAALEKKQIEAREKFAGKIGSSLVKSLGDEGAATVADVIAKMSKSARSKWIENLSFETTNAPRLADASTAVQPASDGVAAPAENGAA